MTPKRPVAGARGWAFADPARRTFVALSRDGSYYHLIHPAEATDRRVSDAVVTQGQLVCECEGGRFRGTCYQVTAAQRPLDIFQAGGEPAPADGDPWFERSPEFMARSEGQRTA